MEEHAKPRPAPAAVGPGGGGGGGTPRKTFLRSASWSVRTTLPPLAVSRLPAWSAAAPQEDGPALEAECSRVTEHIYLGGNQAARSRETLARHRISHVLNCVGFSCPEYFRGELVYKTLWLHDTASEDITSLLYDVFDYLEDVRAGRGRVLVHCWRGVSRSSALVIAYLMWLRRLCFDDAFRVVKSARPGANPNLGFAGQLLLCQARVLAAHPTPARDPRLYRMAPHSPYDPLHLVPKPVEGRPGPLALDSRGAFLVQVPSAIYVWTGGECDPLISRNAKAAAFQVSRYERVVGTMVAVDDGREPAEFWAALGVGRDEDKEGHDMAKARRRRVKSYDADFEIFDSAVRGVIPPFPATGSETIRLPMRENAWSRLRRKLASGMARELLTDSSKVEDGGNAMEEDPPCFSPASSLSSNTPSSSSFSPSSSASDTSFSSSKSSPLPMYWDREVESFDPIEASPQGGEMRLPPWKESRCRSIAERRGSDPPPLWLLAPVEEGEASLSWPTSTKSLARAWSFTNPSLVENRVMNNLFYDG